MMLVLRTLQIASIATALATTIVAATAQDSLQVPGPIHFQGQDYNLVWTSQPAPNYVKQEYVPDDQEVKNFRNLILVELVVGDVTPAQAAAYQIETINARKANDPIVNHHVIQNENTGEVLLDFLISDLRADPPIVEWNAYRYAPYASGQGTVLFGISRRGYGTDGTREFMTKLSSIRSEAIDALATAFMPSVEFQP